MSNITFYGTFSHEIFRNDYSGYSIFAIDIENYDEVKSKYSQIPKKVTCTGIIPQYSNLTPLQVEGTIVENKYGTQIKTSLVREFTWNKATTACYINNICPEIDVASAYKIATLFPDIFLLVRDENASQLLSQKANISEKYSQKLCEQIHKTHIQRVVYEELSPYKVPWVKAMKISEMYGLDVIEKLHSDPYAFGKQCGMDFESCDELAFSIGISAKNSSRIKHLLFKAIENICQNGHVYSTVDEVCKKAHLFSKQSIFSETVQYEIFDEVLSNSEEFVIEIIDGTQAVYSRMMYNTESEVSIQIGRLDLTSKKLNYRENIVNEIETEIGIKYSHQQSECFKLLQHSGIKIIIGGPGTGKTTTVNGVIRAYEKLNPNNIIKLCAPTGRAAQRMSETTGREAMTIHRLLEFNTYDEAVCKKNECCRIRADLVVVDEVSMVDLMLAEKLLTAIEDGATILLIGDENQLPSVGAGDFLNSIIGSESIESVMLTTVYRQESLSHIVVNANLINNGQTSLLDSDEYKTIQCDTARLASEYAVLQAAVCHDRSNPFAMQLLCITRKGEAGTENLNKILQNVLNPPSPSKKELKSGSFIFRVGDKVILTSNNYYVGYFNGDIGIIKEIDDSTLYIEATNKTIELPKENYDDLSLAYAITVHRSQGSEFDNVIFLIPSEPMSMLKRNLIYTAVTRAKRSVLVLSVNDSYKIAIQNEETGKRNTRLREKLADGKKTAKIKYCLSK